MKRRIDFILLGVILCLTVFGMIMIASAGVAKSHEQYQQTYYFFKHQLIYGLLFGLILGYIAFKIDYKIWKKLALPLFVLALVMLSLIYIPQFSYAHGGARRWFFIGGFSFQPSEMMKLFFMIYLAAWFDKHNNDSSKSVSGMVIFLLLVGLVFSLILFQPDLGTAGIIAFCAFFLYILSGAKWKYVLSIAFLGLLALAVLIKVEPYRMARLLAFQNPEINSQGASYQINQSLIAIGSGGPFGVGLGQSRQKFNYLPEPVGDSIYAIVAEEFGLIGSLGTLLAFIIFLIRGFFVSHHAPDRFGALLAGGITIWIATQAFINMSAISGLIPLTGVPLPFISYGGTALATIGLGAGILLNISSHN